MWHRDNPAVMKGQRPGSAARPRRASAIGRGLGGVPLLVVLGLASCGGGARTSSSSSTTPPNQPSPDFSLSVSPAALTLTAGSGGQKIRVNAVPTNGFSSTVSVNISGLPSGVTANPATLSLTPGTAQSTTLTAASGAAAATPTVTLTGTAASLTHAATVALTVQVPSTPPPPPVSPTAPDVTTYHNDNARDGLNAQETILTPSNVNSAQFGKIGFFSVDGKVDAEPLFLAGVTAGGQSRNVLYVATEH